MKLPLFVIFACVAVTAAAQTPSVPPPGTRTKLLALNSPRPEYPDSLKKEHKGGAGIFFLDVDFETGLVSRVDVRQSTGVAQLDQNSITAFRQWRFKPRTVLKGVVIPITFAPDKWPIIGATH